MISSHARQGFDHLLTQAIKTSLLTSAEDTCEVTVLSDQSEITDTRIVMLTVSSFLFRMMVLIYFTPDDATKAYFARRNNLPESDMSQQVLYDAIAEYGNICCGILNRDLGAYFPHIGMSTPNIIDKNCATYLSVLGGNHVKHLKVSLNDAALFHVSLCVCDYADLDFVVDMNQEAEQTGELELF